MFVPMFDLECFYLSTRIHTPRERERERERERSILQVALRKKSQTFPHIKIVLLLVSLVTSAARKLGDKSEALITILQSLSLCIVFLSMCTMCTCFLFIFLFSSNFLLLFTFNCVPVTRNFISSKEQQEKQKYISNLVI